MLFQKFLDRRIERYQNDLMKKYCEEVENMYTKMRTWRHDYKNHIQTLKACMELHDYDEVTSYLDQLDNDLTNVDTVIKTGRVPVDALLNTKLSVAKQNSIKINAKAQIFKECSVKDIDLCVIIGNLLDNAIEENLKLPPERRFLRVYIGKKNTYLYIVFTNAAGKKQNKLGLLFASSKYGASHGFGLAGVWSRVKKYGGSFNVDSEDGGFTAEILIPG